MGDQAGTAAILLAYLGPDDAHDLAVGFELRFGIRKQAGPLADPAGMVTWPSM
jgi:hypothetical protein